MAAPGLTPLIAEVLFLALPLAGCVILGKLLDVSVANFLSYRMGTVTVDPLIGLWRGLQEQTIETIPESIVLERLTGDDARTHWHMVGPQQCPVLTSSCVFVGPALE